MYFNRAFICGFLATILPAFAASTPNLFIRTTRKVTQPIGNLVSTAFSIPDKLIFHSFIKSDLPKNYQDLSAKEKLDLLWQKCCEDKTTVGHTPNSKAVPVFFRNMNECFDLYSDERPWRGVKPIHGSGFVCKGKFIAQGDHPYTGLFKGCDNLLMRPAPGLQPKEGMLLAGISIKFLRDMMHSGNFLSLRKEGTNKLNMNWFNGDPKSHVGSPIVPPIGWFLGMKFRTAKTQFDSQCGICELSDYDQKGNKEANPNFPFEMILRPPSKFDFKKFEDLSDIPAGSKLYDVYAKEKEESPEKLIGSIQTTSEMTYSKWGDLKLFFQHIRREDDLKRLATKEKDSKISKRGGASKCPYMH